MDKILSDYRRPLGEFEVVDFKTDEPIEQLREQLDVELAVNLHWTWSYGSEMEEMRRLYEKGKGGQWNAQTDLDWTTPFTKDEWMINPEGSMMAAICQMMGKDEATQKAAAFDEIGYNLSQLLHGEQAALQLCGQLTPEQREDLDRRLAEADADPDGGVPWEEARERIRQRRR